MTDSTNEINDKTIDIPATQEVESLQAQLRIEHEMYLRSLADFDNYRRRMERDVASSVERGKRDLIFSFLEIMDSFERALQQAGGASAPLVEGLEATHRKTLAFLQTNGITPYKSAGEMFNPALHEAVATVSDSQYAPGMVIDELQRGYRSGEAVLRPALVRVSKQS
jgi:molecular chaperone GrpE